MEICKVKGWSVQNAADAPTNPMCFEVEMEAKEALQQDITIRCMYIIHPADNNDVELIAAEIGITEGGPLVFPFDVPAPSLEVMEASGAPSEVTAIYISFLYRLKEFCRIGHYVRWEYVDPVMQETPPQVPDWTQIRRVLSPPCTPFSEFPNPWDAKDAELDLPPSESAARLARVLAESAVADLHEDGVLLGKDPGWRSGSRSRSRSPKMLHENDLDD